MARTKRIYFRRTKNGWRAFVLVFTGTGPDRALPIEHARAKRLIASGQAVKVDAPPRRRR